MSEPRVEAKQIDLSPSMQRHIFATVVRIPGAMPRVRSVMNPDYFSDQAVADAVAWLNGHWDEFKSTPSKASLLDAFKNEPDTRALVKDAFLEEIPDPEYTIKRIVDFARNRALRSACVMAAGAVAAQAKGDVMRDEKGRPLYSDPDAYIRDLVDKAINVGKSADDLGEDILGGLDAGIEAILHPPAAQLFTTGLAHLDQAGCMIGRGEIGCVLAPAKKGKCVSLDAKLWSPERGPVPAREIAAISRSHPLLAGMDGLKPVVAAVKHRFDIKPMRTLSLHLHSGRIVDGLSTQHKVWVDGHFIPAKDVVPGMYCTSPATLPLSGVASSRDLRLAYCSGVVCGDGSWTIGQGPTLSLHATDDADVLAFWQSALPGSVLGVDNRTVHGIRVRIKTSTMSELAPYGVSQGPKAANKDFPREIYTFGRDAVAAFVAGLFDTDGHCGAAGVEFTFASESLSRGLLDALHVLGIYAVIAYKQARCGPKVFPAWRVQFRAREDLQQFHTMCASLGSHRRKWDRVYLRSRPGVRPMRGNGYRRLPAYYWEEIFSLGVPDPRSTHRHSARRGDRVAHHLHPDFADGAVVFDHVVSVEEGPIVDCVDFEVPGPHTFLCGGVLTHNSHSLLNIAMGNLKQGFNVVYYNMEIKEDRMRERMYRRVAGKTVDQKVDVAAFITKLREKAPRLLKGRCLIKKYPARLATVDDLRAHMSRIVAEGFKPDLVIVDYLGIAKPRQEKEENRFNLESNWLDFRSLCQEFNVAGWSAAQTNRGGVDSNLVTMSQIGECFAIVQHIDVGFSINISQTEYDAGKGRFFVFASRNEQDGAVVPFTFDYSRSLIVTTGVTTATEGAQSAPRPARGSDEARASNHV